MRVSLELFAMRNPMRFCMLTSCHFDLIFVLGFWREREPRYPEAAERRPL